MYANKLIYFKTATNVQIINAFLKCYVMISMFKSILILIVSTLSIHKFSMLVIWLY